MAKTGRAFCLPNAANFKRLSVSSPKNAEEIIKIKGDWKMKKQLTSMSCKGIWWV